MKEKRIKVFEMGDKAEYEIRKFYSCDKCGWTTGEQAEEFRYCPVCGEKQEGYVL